MTEKTEKLWSTTIRCGIPPVCGRWWIRIYAEALLKIYGI